MKRSFQANIDGQVFYIDEDAYTLLNTYLHQLGNTFHGDEGVEIVADIESRIRELFTERISSGSMVIVLSDVQNVIAIMGRPEEIDNESNHYQERHAETVYEEPVGEKTAGTPPPPTKPKMIWTSISWLKHRLFRNMQDKVFGGVFGGLGAYLGWNTNIMRLLYVCLALITYLWPLTLLYLIAWMVIPPAVTPRQVLEMKGEPVNVDSIGQTLISPPVYQEDAGHIITNALKVSAKVLMAFVGLFAGLSVFGCIAAFLAVGAGMIAFGAFGSFAILDGFDLFMAYDLPQMWARLWMIMTALLLGMLVMGSLLWTSCCVVFKTRGASRSTMIAGLIVFAILVAVCITLGALV